MSTLPQGGADFAIESQSRKFAHHYSFLTGSLSKAPNVNLIPIRPLVGSVSVLAKLSIGGCEPTWGLP